MLPLKFSWLFLTMAFICSLYRLYDMFRAGAGPDSPSKQVPGAKPWVWGVPWGDMI